jgi:hypothetical protein
MPQIASTDTRRTYIRTAIHPSPRGQLCIDFLSTRSQLIGLFHRCNELQEELYKVAQVTYKQQIAELRFLAAVKKLEISKQKTIELKKREAEVLLLLAAKEREIEKAQWEMVQGLAERNRGRSHTL